jgi:hypothetical protein
MTTTTGGRHFAKPSLLSLQLALRIFALIALGWVTAYAISLPLAIAMVPGRMDHAVWLNNGAFMALNYFDTGFARRELEGTLIRLFTRDPLIGGVAFDVISCGALATLMFWATLRAPISHPQRAAIRLVFAAVLFRVAQDVGRADAAVMVCGLVGAWAAKSGRWMIVAITIAVALAFHETGFIVLAPLVAVVVFEHDAWRKGNRAGQIAALLIVAVALAAYAWTFHAPIDVRPIARKIHTEFRNPAWPDVNLYFNLSGARGLRTILCMRDMDDEYLSKVLKGFGVALAAAIALRPKRLGLTMLATIPPFMFLSVIAIDVARWAVFAAFGAAVMAALDNGRGAKWEPQFVAPLLAAALAALLVLKTGMENLGDPMPVLGNFQYSQRGVLPSSGATLDYCDPDWRMFLGLPGPDKPQERQ